MIIYQGTAEIPMMGFHSNEILSKEELPKRYLAFSPCYRREAGAHSKILKDSFVFMSFINLSNLFCVNLVMKNL